jgi:hypothetical protein
MKGKGGFALFGIIANSAKNVKRTVDKWRNKPKRSTSEIQGIQPRQRRKLGYFDRFKGQAGNKMYRRLRRRQRNGIILTIDKTPEARKERNKQRRKIQRRIDKMATHTARVMLAR